MLSKLIMMSSRVRTRFLFNRRRVAFGPQLRVYGHLPRVSNGGKITIGRNVYFLAVDDAVRLKTVDGGVIEIGDDAGLGDGAVVFAKSKVTIGPGCLLGGGVVMIDYGFHAVHEDSVAKPRPITLGQNVWLARNVTIMPGVTIGDHSVVAAGSVVFDDIPARQIWRGNPAVYVRDVRASDSFRRR